MPNALKRQPVVVNPLFRHSDEQCLSLSGEWLFRLDPDERGLRESWATNPHIFLETIHVPGCWQGQGFGSDETEIHKEFDTAIRAFRATYEGTGWYAKVFTIPPELQGKRLWLNFGGSNPTTEVWLNGEKIGEHHLPLLSFGFEITDLVSFDKENVLAVRISEQDRLLGLTYYYSGKWSGLYRDVEITATGNAYLDSLSAYPDVDSGALTVKAAVGGTAENTSLSVTVTAPNGETFFGEAAVKDGACEIDFAVENPALWSPDDPALYRVDAVLCENGVVSDARADRFGFMKLTTEGKHFCINHEPYYMRGSGDFCDNPETGSPNTSRAHWRKCLRALRDMGYNYVRCQSFVPVPEYFDVADEVGLIIQSEMGMLGPIAGKSVYHTYGMWPKPTPDYRDNYRDQWNGIVLRDVNHPAANIYCMSNELGETYFPKTAWRCYRETKELKPTAMIIWTDGDYKPQYPSDFANIRADHDEFIDLPVIQHEFQWWSSFPDVRLASKYKNCALRHFSAELAIEAIGRRGFLHVLPKAAETSQALQYIEAKCKMEQLRRDYPTLAGVCHFNAMDIGMSPQGILDIFYEKKHATPEMWLQTNGDTVILSNLNFADRVLTTGMEWTFDFSVSDFSHPAFGASTLSWSLTAEDRVLFSDSFACDPEPYRTSAIGETVTLTVPSVEKPEKVTLTATLTDGKRSVKNAWDLWIFPAKTALPNGVCRADRGEAIGEARVVIAERLTDELIEFVQAGGSLILIGAEGLVRPFQPILNLEVGRYYFTHPASFPPYEELQSGTIIQDHPIFGDFPKGDFADLQFYNMIAENAPLDLEPLDLVEVDPIIRVLHSYQVSRQLGHLVERKLGAGRIVVTSMNLLGELPEAQYLLSQMARYCMDDALADCPELSEKALAQLVSGTNID